MLNHPFTPTPVHRLVDKKAQQLLNAAYVLGGKAWHKRANNLFDGLRTDNSLAGHTGREIRAFHELLTSADARSSFDPMSTHDADIDLLASELSQAVNETRDTQKPTPESSKETIDD